MTSSSHQEGWSLIDTAPPKKCCVDFLDDEGFDMADDTKERTLTEEELKAKARLDSAVQELQKAVEKYPPIAMGASAQLQIMQLDALAEVLAEVGVLPRTRLWELIAQKVDDYTTQCRRAILSQGGASALSGLRQKGN